MLLELRGDRPCGHPTLVGKPRLIHLAGTSFCAPLHSVKPWRLEDVLGKPLGRRGEGSFPC